MKKGTALLAAFVLGIVLTASVALSGEHQAYMKGALKNLRQARVDLAKASDDKGPYKGIAMDHIDQAITAVQQGIDWDNTHKEK